MSFSCMKSSDYAHLFTHVDLWKIGGKKQNMGPMCKIGESRRSNVHNDKRGWRNWLTVQTLRCWFGQKRQDEIQNCRLITAIKNNIWIIYQKKKKDIEEFKGTRSKRCHIDCQGRSWARAFANSRQKLVHLAMIKLIRSQVFLQSDKTRRKMITEQ